MKKSKSILIIDDDIAILESLSLFLVDQQYQVSTLTSFSKVSDISSLSPDIILLDYWIGDKNGGEFCKQLKSDKTTKHIPLILMSANNMLSTISKSSPADSYIEKPFDIEKLLSLIKSL